jgi:DNA mismatch repair protein MutS
MFFALAIRLRVPRATMKITPMLRQYLDAKEQYPDSLLLFRMGDFYELFFDDAKIAADALDIALTSRNKGDPDEIPMAGVPHHSISGYVQKLIKAGYKVAVCEQMEDPSEAKGIVRREVVRVVTPGVCLDVDAVEARASNFLAAAAPVSRRSRAFALALCDVSTGELRLTEVASADGLVQELERAQARELLWPDDVPLPSVLARAHESAPDPGVITRVPAATARKRSLGRRLRELHATFGDREFRSAVMAPNEVEALVDVVDGLGLRHPKAGRAALCALLHYIADMQLGVPAHLAPPEAHRPQDHVALDSATEANLEIFQALIGGGRANSLLSVVDFTVTAAGGRLLRQVLAYPLIDVARIEARLDAVERLTQSQSRRTGVRDVLSEVGDMPRLVSRIISGGANARDLVALRDSLARMPDLKALAEEDDPALLGRLFARLDPCRDLVELLRRALVDEPPASTREGGMLREGFDADLDELIELSRSGKQWLLRYEAEQRGATGIDSLKLRFNKVFGYYLEVTKANLDRVPDDYIRKQTLANSERYFTLDLKEYEDKILGAKDRRAKLEAELFDRLVERVVGETERIQQTAGQVAKLDLLAGFAELAVRYRYARPVVDDGLVTHIVEGRHPVVERTQAGERFVPNSVHLDAESAQLLIVTGPNMAGKSTIIRQVALIALLAQVGSFVPAKEAHLGVVDQIFSRVGASDNLAQGQSTFMVEMTQTAHILRHATRRSLIVLDEIGRGTSTFDGLSIAWAVAEHICDVIGARALFATHYHELTELARTRERARNVSVAVKEWNDEIVFLRRLVDSPANKSYGIQVGRLAGLPQKVVERARQVLSNLESAEFTNGGLPILSLDPATPPPDSMQLDLFAMPGIRPGAANVIAALEEVDLDVMSPIEALNLIYSLKQNLKSG